LSCKQYEHVGCAYPAAQRWTRQRAKGFMGTVEIIPSAENDHRARKMELPEYDLPHAGPDGACHGRNNDSISRLGQADVEEAEIGREAIESQHAEIQ
jgi:hypothetical protein